MLKAGITGGIGSGKTIVCQVFETLGIPVLYADTVARQLMESDARIIAGVRNLFGEQAYTGGRLNNKYIGSVVFADKEKLQQLNALTHPIVIQYGADWMARQQGDYALKEAALFFESGSHLSMDVMIGVAAPLELRISRTIQRDGLSRQTVLDRIAKQMDQEEKMKRCDFVILNDEKHSIIDQVYTIHKALLQRLQQTVVL
ncbi:dephospho-CoA kinase [Rurimicrobium arvi]|uniref:Dephospho-CoA kinase n=1 Tax=Rurimicrobium arvi TaxID=2049916 RepID=A0ABP8MYQ9_9BACT